MGAFLLGGAVNATLPQEDIDTMLDTARAAKLPLQHQLTYLLGAVDDLGDPRDLKFVGVTNLSNLYELKQKQQRYGSEFNTDLSQRIVSYLTSRLDGKLATSAEYINGVFKRALENFEANIRARVITTLPEEKLGESESGTSRRISIGMNIRSVDAGLAKVKADMEAWNATYAQKASHMSTYDVAKSVLRVLNNMDDSEQQIISWGSV